MILICDAIGLNNEQLHHIQQVLVNSEVLTLQLPNNADDVYTKLAYSSLYIEDHILDNNRVAYSSKYTSILILFDNYINDIENLYSYVCNMRTDELIFPSRTPSYKAGWFIGHPLAVIKLLSSILDLKQYKWPDTISVGWGNPFKDIEYNYTNDIMHWAHRINLKVGSLK